MRPASEPGCIARQSVYNGFHAVTFFNNPDANTRLAPRFAGFSA
jgi:hypothetical protein